MIAPGAPARLHTYPNPRKDIAIVPIVVGSISQQVEAEYGTLLAPYLARPDTLFVISSDFCHWCA